MYHSRKDKMNKRTFKGIRSDLDLTQEEMSKMLSIPLETYKKYERYETKIPAEVLIKVADAGEVRDVREIRIK